jgi:hypothetical protein
MESLALILWDLNRTNELNRFEQILRLIGAKGPSVRGARQQINHAYVLMLSSQFQGFCRELHSECVNELVERLSPPGLRAVVRQSFLASRFLDRGNATWRNIGDDFNRLGMTFWDDVIATDSKNANFKNRLDSLNNWRNAIAHNDFDPAKLGHDTLTLEMIRDWRKACDSLARVFDNVTRLYLTKLAES